MKKNEFRAWDKDYKKMFYNIGILPLKHPCKTQFVEGFFSFRIGLKNIIIMQYTGLNDRRNIKIFERDIIDIWHCIDGKFIKVRACISFESPCFRTDFGRRVQLHSTCEVVGNELENPNLLKENENI